MDIGSRIMLEIIAWWNIETRGGISGYLMLSCLKVGCEFSSDHSDLM